MAYSQGALSTQIIDLTESDNYDDGLQILSSTVSRAQQVAFPLTDSLQTMALHKDRTETPTTSRIPRQAAVNASNSLAEVYQILNPLEERLQASSTTPKKPGRTRKDEWTPTSYNSGTGRSKGQRSLAQDDPVSPTLSLSERLVVNRHRSALSATARDGPVTPMKRKCTSPLLEPASPSKLIRAEALPDRESTLGKGSFSQSSLQGPSPQTNGDFQQVTPPLIPVLATSVVLAEKPVHGDHPAINSNMRIGDILEDLAYPIVNEEKSHHRGQLTDESLISICEAVTKDVTEEEIFLSVQRLYDVDETQREHIKRSVKSRFRQRVAQFLTIPSDTLEESVPEPTIQHSVQEKSITKEDVEGLDKVSRTRITDLSEYLSKLESETLGKDSLAPEQVISPIQGELLAEPAWNDNIEQETPTTWTRPSATTPSDTAFSSDQPVPPEFDRGRFPAQRRRRGNKFYAPPRLQTTSNLNTLESVLPLSEKQKKSASKESSSLRHPLQTAQTKGTPVPLHHVRQDEYTEMLSKQSELDPYIRDLLHTTASGRGTELQGTEVQHYVDALELRFNSSERGLAPKSSEMGNRGKPTNSMNNNAAHSMNPAFSLSDMQGNPSDKENGVNSLGGMYNPRVKENKINKFRRLTSDTQGYPTPRPAMGSEELASDSSERVRFNSMSLSDPVKLRQLASFAVASPTQQRKPILRTLATARDSYLERLAADLVSEEFSISETCADANFCSIDNDEQRRLVYDTYLLKYVDPISRSHGLPLAIPAPRTFVTIETEVVDPVHRNQRSTASLLRNRELGTDSRGRHVHTQNELRLRNAEKIETWRSWKGASGDIVTAAWASDSTTYAFGAAAHANDEDLQYNRPCNLLLGDLQSNILTELPDHRVDRPKPDSISGGPNANQAVYDACDPMVYKTVTAVAFAPFGSRMYTASHDQTVKVWDASLKECQGTLSHDGWVTSIEASTQVDGLFATATKTMHNSICVYYTEGGSLSCTQFSSSRAELRPDWQIYPESLRWGSNPNTSHLLLAGFHQWGDDRSESGQLMLWDAHHFQSIKVSPSSQSVYAAAWHPSSPLFATGGSPGNVVTDKLSTKSVVRTWDLRSTTRYTMEYECSALDMQDVTFSPVDPNIITAGCTDGTTFVWDFRRPDEPLHRLRHGRPIIDWDHTRDREEADTGVMMSLWGLGGNIFYTGSSDGMIKAWDMRRHPADVLVRNVAQFEAGVQCGAISPDGTNLLVGDADGGIHILSSAPCGRRAKDEDAVIDGAEEPIALVRAPDGSGLKIENDDNDAGTEGRDHGRQLIHSGQLALHPEFGVTKGPNYHGPWARDSRKPGSQPREIGKLLPNSAKLQAFSKRGEEREEIAQPRRDMIKARKMKIDDELSKLSTTDQKSK